MSAPTVLSDDTRTLLDWLARKLDNRPDDAMREETRRAQCLVLAEQLHGPTEAAFDAEQDLLAAAPPVRPNQTRGEYAALLRLIAQGVSQ
ncbi:hypothetical protein OOK13_40340 [Streptomyces sp. NBC_00378]|uniref:hypothetical protein n=1 Tax=Streptomyces sp. NBC_00378 TaxID=2975732 RepID=UPI00224F35CE|nr:hypothetical protein [Streptomyces sp. NBC_00378]MCX5112193.1 hypothetical protein [Streptomyces sp. NBC_00378]MCX5114612.1 hypothetical protein [Streptomyces sp. NBC_00378]